VKGNAMPITEVAFASGFGSLRQFNDSFRKAFGMPPREFRASNNPLIRKPMSLDLKLKYETPIEWAMLARVVGSHAVPFLEKVSDDGFFLTRLVSSGSSCATVAIDLRDYVDHVKVSVETDDSSMIDLVVSKVRRLFDLDHNPAAVTEAFSGDPLLGTLVAMRPGMRIAGSFDPYELLVHTIIGQQISVAAARTFTSRLVKEFGEEHGGLHLFPSAEALVSIDPQVLYEKTGINHKKVATIQAVSELVSGGLSIDGPSLSADVAAALLAVKGIGPWSVEYLALRGLGDPDAFPADDLIIKRRLDVKNAKSAIVKAEAWRPFRGYAAMYLWAGGANV